MLRWRVEPTLDNVVENLDESKETWVDDFVDNRLHDDFNRAQAIGFGGHYLVPRVRHLDRRKWPNVKSKLQMLLFIA